MLTKADCVNARYGQTFRYLSGTYARSKELKQVRVSGKCQTWKTRPDDFKLPVKYGMYESLYITPENAAMFITEDEYQRRKDQAQAVGSVLDAPAMRRNPSRSAKWMKYRGKYPNNIAQVATTGQAGVVEVTTNNGLSWLVYARDTGGKMPKVGEDGEQYTQLEGLRDNQFHTRVRTFKNPTLHLKRKRVAPSLSRVMNRGNYRSTSFNGVVRSAAQQRAGVPWWQGDKSIIAAFKVKTLAVNYGKAYANHSRKSVAIEKRGAEWIVREVRK